jgi:hypothetical protein
MPEIKKDESRSDYIARCVPYCMKHEGLDHDAAVGKCEGLYTEYLKKGNQSANETIRKGYVPFALTANCLQYAQALDQKSYIGLSDIKTEIVEIEGEQRKYDVVDAVVAVGNRFYGNIYVPSNVLKATVHLWESTYNDISHLGTMFPAGLFSTENIEYITGFNSDSYFDENINAVRVKMHIYHNAPKYSSWKSFMDISKDAKKIPNVSIFGFSKFELIHKDKLPFGTIIPEGVLRGDHVIVMSELIPMAITTCLKGKCDDEAGCGISAFSNGSCDCKNGTCEVGTSNDTLISINNKINIIKEKIRLLTEFSNLENQLSSIKKDKK